MTSTVVMRAMEMSLPAAGDTRPLNHTDYEGLSGETLNGVAGRFIFIMEGLENEHASLVAEEGFFVLRRPYEHGDWLSHQSAGKVKDRGFHFSHRHTFCNETIKRLQDFFVNPKLPACSTYLGRDILEEVEVLSTPFLMGNGCLAQFSATDRAEMFVRCGFCGHGLLLRRRAP